MNHHHHYHHHYHHVEAPSIIESDSDEKSQSNPNHSSPTHELARSLINVIDTIDLDDSYLDNNQLSGAIPSTIGSLTNLQQLYRTPALQFCLISLFAGTLTVRFSRIMQLLAEQLIAESLPSLLDVHTSYCERRFAIQSLRTHLSLSLSHLIDDDADFDFNRNAHYHRGATLGQWVTASVLPVIWLHRSQLSHHRPLSCKEPQLPSQLVLQQFPLRPCNGK